MQNQNYMPNGKEGTSGHRSTSNVQDQKYQPNGEEGTSGDLGPTSNVQAHNYWPTGNIQDLLKSMGPMVRD